jgi:oxysterol-binding protein-related protein 8
MEGRAVLTLLNRESEEYVITQPNMYARFEFPFLSVFTNLNRGILFGRMKFELGDHSMIRCEKTGLVADIEFKTKGFISGTYNAITGKIRRDIPGGEALYEISGKWTEEMWVKNIRTGERELLFNADGAKHTPCQVRPLEEQEERESRKLWAKVTQAIIKRDQYTATEAKSAIEDRQREETRTRDADGVTWHPRFFKRVDESFYILNHKL